MNENIEIIEHNPVVENIEQDTSDQVVNPDDLGFEETVEGDNSPEGGENIEN